MRYQISIDDELAQRVNLYAKKNYLSRSGLITLALTQFLQANEAITALTSISLTMEKIAAAGAIDDETKQSLEDIERTLAILTGK